MAKLGRSASKGFVRGREAMRKLAAEEFDRLGSAYFSGSEVAGFLERMPGPKPDDEEDSDEQEESERGAKPAVQV